MRKFALDKNQIIILLIAALTPIAGCFLYLLSQGIFLWDVSPISTGWSDEVLYIQSIKALIEYGKPLGVFGFNESIARVGSLGAWSVFTMYPFVVVGKIFGFSYAMPVVTNLVFSAITLIVFVLVVRPDLKQMLWVAAIYMGFAIFFRYILAVSPECTICNFSLLCLIFLIGYIKSEGKGEYIYFAFFEFFMIWLVLMRGYYAIFGLIFLYFSIKKKAPKVFYLIQIILLAVSLIGFVYIMLYCLAPYLTDTRNFELLSQIFTNPAVGIKAFLSLIYHNGLETLGYIGQAFTFTSMRGSWWLLFFLAAAWFLYKAIKEKRADYVIALATYFIFMMTMYVLYDAKEGSRQVMALAFVGLIFIAYREEKRAVKIAFLIVAIYMTWLSTDAHYIGVNKNSKEIQAVYSDGEEKLSQVLKLSDDLWDNTVIVPLSINDKEMLAIPVGFGLNVCDDGYVMENSDELICRYLFTCTDTELDDFAKKQGWELLTSYGSSNLYQLR